MEKVCFLIFLCFILISCSGNTYITESQPVFVKPPPSRINLKKPKMPATLANSKLYMVIANGSGDFKNWTNKEYVAEFDGENKYKLYRQENGELVNSGDYVYSPGDNQRKTAHLKLIDEDNRWNRDILDIKMNFSAVESGTYQAESSNNARDSQSGIFEVQ